MPKTVVFLKISWKFTILPKTASFGKVSQLRPAKKIFAKKNFFFPKNMFFSGFCPIFFFLMLPVWEQQKVKINMEPAIAKEKRWSCVDSLVTQGHTFLHSDRIQKSPRMAMYPIWERQYFVINCIYIGCQNKKNSDVAQLRDVPNWGRSQHRYIFHTNEDVPNWENFVNS